jgi:hypothetical protein
MRTLYSSITRTKNCVRLFLCHPYYDCVTLV